MSFTGASVSDMVQYVKTTVQRNLDAIIIFIGT